MTARTAAFDIRYLGTAPISAGTPQETQEDMMDSAVGMLIMKLQRLNQKAVLSLLQKVAMEPTESNIRKMEKKMDKEGKDVRMGDKAAGVITDASFTVRDPTSEDATNFATRNITSVKTYPRYLENKAWDLTAIVYQMPRGLSCFAFLCDSSKSLTFHETLLFSIRQALVAEGIIPAEEQELAEEEPEDDSEAAANIPEDNKKASSKDKKSKKSKAKAEADKDNLTITMGVGFNRESSVRMSRKLRRKNTVNLDGTGQEKLKRASAAFGATFTSLITSGSSAQKSSLPAAAADVERKRLPSQSSSSSIGASPLPGSEALAGLGEDDALDIDESLFSSVDILEDKDVEGLNLEHFGFGGGDEEEFGF